MKDSMALAYVNLFAILGAIPKLCELDAEAAELIRGTDTSVCFSVKGGPVGTLVFKDGVCRMVVGDAKAKIKLPFATPEKFNGLIDGTVTPIPSRGLLQVGFLLKKFMPLTDILTKYLRAEPEALADRAFFEKSTELMLGVIARAVCQLANTDKVSRASASYIVDGRIKIEIGGGPCQFIDVEDHFLALSDSNEDRFTSYMKFKDIDTARDLFDGRINAVAAVGLGDVMVGGMISQVDNVNRILDRVSLYLA
jgi:hypothetical protein